MQDARGVWGRIHPPYDTQRLFLYLFFLYDFSGFIKPTGMSFKQPINPQPQTRDLLFQHEVSLVLQLSYTSPRSDFFCSTGSG